MPRTGSKGGSARDRQARIAAAREAAARAERQARLRRIGLYAGIAVVVVALIVGTALYVSNRGSSSSAARSGLPNPPAASGTALPPWPAPADPKAGITKAGLRSGTAEGTAEHFHSHLDIFVNGKRTPVPADLGINTTTAVLAELHTHDATGVLHIEAPDNKHRFVLGQLFTEWGVRLDATQIGGLTATGGKTLRAYVNGKQVSGDPARIQLTPHREIALVYGPAGQHVQVPTRYAFPAGL